MTQAPLAKPPSKQTSNPQPQQAEGDKADAVASPMKPKPVTLRTIAKMAKQGEKFPCLTCYDATTARWLAVKRGAPNTLVMADMPFMSYQADEAEGIRNAGRFMTEGLADAVKIEVDQSFTSLVKQMARAGVPVVAHIGSLPQRAKMQGGYRSVGRTAKQAQAVVDDALALEEAGAVMLLLEACPNEVSSKVVEKTSIPVIGCGAGPACHGQIVVLQDLLGLTDWQPSFARPITALGKQIISAADQWIQMVKASNLGEHPYKMAEGELEKFSNTGTKPHS